MIVSIKAIMGTIDDVGRDGAQRKGRWPTASPSVVGGREGNDARRELRVGRVCGEGGPTLRREWPGNFARTKASHPHKASAFGLSSRGAVVYARPCAGARAGTDRPGARKLAIFIPFVLREMQIGWHLQFSLRS